MAQTKKEKRNRSGIFDGRIGVTILVFLVFVVVAASIFLLSNRKESDLAAAFPSESIAYLETRDAGKLIGTMAENAGAKKRDELNALDGVGIAIAIKSFESEEKELTGDAAVLSFGPKFAAALEFGGWGSQAFIDGKLDEFVRSIYGKETTRTLQNGKSVNLTVWKASDGRQVFAVVAGAYVVFGNDSEFVERCFLASAGKIRTLAADENLKSFRSENREALVTGYFPKKSVDAIADIAGVMAAVSGSDQPNVRSFIAGVVPKLIKNSVQNVYWKASARDGQLYDTIETEIGSENGAVLSETITPARFEATDLLSFVPSESSSVSRYSTSDMRISYRSLAIVAARNSEAPMVAAVSTTLLNSYGISDSESFLSSTKGGIITVRTSTNSNDAAIVAFLKDKELARKSFTEEVEVQQSGLSEYEPESTIGDGSALTALIVGDVLLIGNQRAVNACVEAKKGSKNLDDLQSLISSEASAATVSVESTDYSVLEKMFAGKRDSVPKESFLIETNFRKNLMIRKYRSRFGLLGSFIVNTSD